MLGYKQPSEPSLDPRAGLPPRSPDSERKVYDAIAPALPRGWSAWRSLKIRIKAGDFSKANFVIADPARGILVLEVKGGIVRKQDGVWFQNERPMKMLPFDQAHRFVRVLLGEFGARAGSAAMNFLARRGVGRDLEGLRLRHGDHRRGPGLRHA